jgi:hypothetical protein
MYEHPAPVSPLEERYASDAGKDNNSNMNIEDLQKMPGEIKGWQE